MGPVVHIIFKMRRLKVFSLGTFVTDTIVKLPLCMLSMSLHGVALSADFYEHLYVKIHVQVFIKISWLKNTLRIKIFDIKIESYSALSLGNVKKDLHIGGPF